jgi:hypothetical protein
VNPSVGWWGRRWLHQVVAVLPYGLGLPVALLALAGVVVAVRRRTPADRLLLVAVVPYYAYMGSFVTAYPRYMLPIFPGLALLAAAGLGRLARPAVAALVATLVIAYGVALSGSQVARFSWDQQAAVGDWLGSHAKLVPLADHRVAITSNMEIDPYYRLREHIAPRGYAVIVQHPGHWLEGRPGFFVLPEWQSIAIRRDRRDPALVAALDALEGGRSGYQPVLRIPIPPYLQRPLDERLDPAFAVDLWQGAIGFTVYARDDLAVQLTAPEPPASAGAPASPRPDGTP